MTYSAASVQHLPWPRRHPQDDGSFRVAWDLELTQPLPTEIQAAGEDLREAALSGLTATLRAQGHADLVPTPEETRLFRVRVEAKGGPGLRLQLHLVDDGRSLALALTAQVWIAIERRYARIRAIQGVERAAWSRYLGPDV